MKAHFIASGRRVDDPDMWSSSTTVEYQYEDEKEQKCVEFIREILYFEEDEEPSLNNLERLREYLQEDENWFILYEVAQDECKTVIFAI